MHGRAFGLAHFHLENKHRLGRILELVYWTVFLMQTIQKTLETITERLERAGVPSPRVDAEALLEFVTGFSRSALILERHRKLDPDVLEQLELRTRRRESREPLQWILGFTYFYGLELQVRPGVLIPRPETERLVEIVLNALRDSGSPRVLDIGTGTGAIALALKHELPQTTVLATDIDLNAVNVALENARSLGLEITVHHGDLLDDFEPPFDAIISNPPYLMETDLDGLEPEVRRDPHAALFSGPDGLDLARRIVQEARDALNPGGLLALELDPRNVDTLAAELENTVWDDVVIHKDLTGRDRFLTARRATPPSRASEKLMLDPPPLFHRGGLNNDNQAVHDNLPAIALDVGEARIGFAASDAQGRFAFGRGYHTRSKLEADINAVREFLERENAKVVVVGLPLRTDGADSPQTQKVRIFTAALETAGLPVVFQDERFTTRIATQNLMAQTKKKRQEKGNTDEASAVAILETWLSKRPKT
jgi:release factor glutamine methyltransferase